MIIRKLEVQGFKSFPDRQSLHFGAGISGVVGPNGCGKSNIVDAVKWCLGEQSARSLRGKAMQDVIFGGSESRKPMGLAEVTLTFAAGGEPFPGEYARLEELQVSRRLFRDGHSEYLINQQRVRLRDIQDIFLDSGVGNRMYSFIEQGRIGEIVNARPEQRRALIEEAAGISRYKARRDEAAQRLEGTLQNLERATDVVEDLSARLKALERQVAKAMRHRRLRSFIRQGEIVLGLARYAALAADRRALAGQLREAEHQEADRIRQEERKDQELVSGREEVEVLAAGLELVRDRLAELEATRRETESARQYQAKELENLQRRIEGLGRQQQEAELRRESAEARVSTTATELAERERDVRSLDAELGTARNAVGEAQQVVRDRRRRIDQGKSSVLELVREVAGKQARLEGMGRQAAELEGRRRRLRDMRDEADTGLGQLVKEVAAAEAAVAQAEEALTAARAARIEAGKVMETAREEEIAARAGRTRAEGAQREADRRGTQLETRLEGLQALQAEHAGVDDASRALLELPGVRGPLAGLLDVPEELEPVLTAALGQALDALVVDDLAAARRAVEAAEGSASILIPSAEAPSAEGTWWEAITGDEVAVRVLAGLLDEVERVGTVDQALARWQEAGLASVLADADGPVLSLAQGRLSVGRPRVAGAAMLGRRREIHRLVSAVAEATQQRAEARAALEEADVALAAASEAAQSSRRAHDEARRAQDEAALALREGRSQHASRKAELARRESEHGRIAGEVDKLGQQLEQLVEQRARLETDVAGAQARQAAVERELKTEQSELGEESRRLGAAREALSALTSREAGLRERVVGLRRSLAELGEARDAATRQRDQARAEAAKAALRCEELVADDARLGEQLQELGEKQAAERETLEGQRKQHQAAKAALAVQEDALRELRKAREKATQRRQELDRQIQRVREEIGRIREQLDERYQVSVAGLLDRIDRSGHVLVPADAAAKEGGIPGLTEPKGVEERWVEDVAVTSRLLEDEEEISDWVDRLKHAREAFRRLGEVNLVAVREYEEVQERYATLEGQRADLEASVASIRQTIGKLNRICRERFRDSFDRVNAYFQEIYPRLVGGGSGRLVLTDEEDLLETGVDILVQPPGKRVRSLSLLSGGETAMVAISLIFALFRVKPSPFCLLDEVDAPLDEGNGARFNDMLREMAELAQFIVITHNKKTMECADTLYGVTMNVPGVSELVSVQLS